MADCRGEQDMHTAQSRLVAASLLARPRDTYLQPPRVAAQVEEDEAGDDQLVFDLYVDRKGGA